MPHATVQQIFPDREYPRVELGEPRGAHEIDEEWGARAAVTLLATLDGRYCERPVLRLFPEGPSWALATRNPGERDAIRRRLAELGRVCDPDAVLVSATEARRVADETRALLARWVVLWACGVEHLLIEVADGRVTLERRYLPPTSPTRVAVYALDADALDALTAAYDATRKADDDRNRVWPPSAVEKLRLLEERAAGNAP